MLSLESTGLNAQDIEGRTAAIHASQTADVRSLDILIATGADLNIQDNSGKTALVYAAMGGKELLFAGLLVAGADQAITDTQGRSAIALAIKAGHADAARLILLRDNQEIAPQEIRQLWFLAVGHGNQY